MQVYNGLCLGPQYACTGLPNPRHLGQPGKIKKKLFEVLIFYIKKTLRNNPYGYKLKDYFKIFFLFHFEKDIILSY